MRWETRYSPSEMVFLEIEQNRVIMYLNSRHYMEGRWSFDEILAGDADSSISGPFRAEVLAELKAELSRPRPEAQERERGIKARSNRPHRSA